MYKIVVYKNFEKLKDIIDFDENMSLEYIYEILGLNICIEEYKKRHKKVFMDLFNLSEENFFIVALDDDRIVGLLWMGIRIDTVTYEKICYIYDIEIEKDYRNKGIGTSLIKKGFEICRNNNIRKMALMTDIMNKSALKWYMKLGFRISRFYLIKSDL
ncbi:MAG: hypothetical protein B6U95_07650 [Thermofilum sp. ex4484_82]|nr:MAG: hypothetical protein B6U95_07650 [Thermofilum sp. ex4484_82]OYT36995.1 MAG: hypothetical protein B6U96_07650 [Archaeoglobales archaeon ex4484_92]